MEGMYKLATELGVKFEFDCNVTAINIDNGKATHVQAEGGRVYEADVVIGGADYHFVETKLLPENYRTYSDRYWDKRLMAPSCLLYYVGLDKKVEVFPIILCSLMQILKYMARKSIQPKNGQPIRCFTCPYHL